LTSQPANAQKPLGTTPHGFPVDGEVQKLSQRTCCQLVTKLLSTRQTVWTFRDSSPCR